jgi:hypothetical protein
MIGGDFNASMGISNDKKDKSLGPFGIKHANKASERLRCFLAGNELSSTTSFFQKKNYVSWRHFGRCNMKFQIDYWIVKNSDLKKVRDAATDQSIAIDSDHVPVKITIRLAHQLRIKHWSELKGKIDYGLLYRAKPEDENFLSDALSCQELRDEFYIRIEKALLSEERRVSAEQWENTDTNAILIDAIKEVAEELLSTSPKKFSSWFHYRSDDFMTLIRKRNTLLQKRNTDKRAEES